MDNIGFLLIAIASILFSVFVFQELNIPAAETILRVTFLTVSSSILLHSITAAPAAKWYGNMVRKMGKCEEIVPVPEFPPRAGLEKEPSKNFGKGAHV